jgi:hypothetical protein
MLELACVDDQMSVDLNSETDECQAYIYHSLLPFLQVGVMRAVANQLLDCSLSDELAGFCIVILPA